MSDEEKKKRARRWRMLGMVLGFALAVACRSVPADYQQACKTVAEFAVMGGC